MRSGKILSSEDQEQKSKGPQYTYDAAFDYESAYYFAEEKQKLELTTPKVPEEKAAKNDKTGDEEFAIQFAHFEGMALQQAEEKQKLELATPKVLEEKVVKNYQTESDKKLYNLFKSLLNSLHTATSFLDSVAPKASNPKPAVTPLSTTLQNQNIQTVKLENLTTQDLAQLAAHTDKSIQKVFASLGYDLLWAMLLKTPTLRSIKGVAQITGSKVSSSTAKLLEKGLSITGMNQNPDLQALTKILANATEQEVIEYLMNLIPKSIKSEVIIVLTEDNEYKANTARNNLIQKFLNEHSTEDTINFLESLRKWIHDPIDPAKNAQLVTSTSTMFGAKEAVRATESHHKIIQSIAEINQAIYQLNIITNKYIGVKISQEDEESMGTFDIIALKIQQAETPEERSKLLDEYEKERNEAKKQVDQLISDIEKNDIPTKQILLASQNHEIPNIAEATNVLKKNLQQCDTLARKNIMDTLTKHRMTHEFNSLSFVEQPTNELNSVKAAEKMVRDASELKQKTTMCPILGIGIEEITTDIGGSAVSLKGLINSQPEKATIKERFEDAKKQHEQWLPENYTFCGKLLSGLLLHAPIRAERTSYQMKLKRLAEEASSDPSITPEEKRNIELELKKISEQVHTISASENESESSSETFASTNMEENKKNNETSKRDGSPQGHKDNIGSLVCQAFTGTVETITENAMKTNKDGESHVYHCMSP